MSTISAGTHPALRKDNITFAPGSGGLGMVLIVAGVVGVAAAFGLAQMGFANAWARQALFSYHVGAMAVLAPCLASVIFLMIFNLLNAGWVATLRRQFENIASFIPIAFALVMAGVVVDLFVLHGRMFSWYQAESQHDPLLQKKWAWFFAPAGLPKPEELGQHAVFPLFFIVRCAFYGIVWTSISRKLIALSRRLDETGDPAYAAKARFTSSWGLLVMALTTAFASFDWLMGTDYRFFSTMWGVYYFAGAAFSMWATIALIFALAKSKGKLDVAVTHEHFHDIGKMLFSFTVFWGYIAFSQYFLIWYSNIPEETSYYLFRMQDGWNVLGALLIFGHFVVPFLFLISRHIKRNYALLSLGAVIAILAHVADIFWVVRPMVYATDAKPEQLPSGGALVIDALAVLGVVLIFAGYLVRKVASGPLVGVGDPFMGEGLEHRNYV